MLRTPDRRLRVFVSSTLGELAAERLAARRAIESLNLIPVMFDLGARDHPPQLVYRDYLQQSDIFIGIYWQSYGQPVPGSDRSGLEEELLLAAQKPRLIYLKEPSPERDDRLGSLIEQVWQSGVSTTNVTGTEDLADRIISDLALLLSERFERAIKNLPVGTVTFFFADIEDSTPNLEHHGEGYADLLARFRRESEDLITRSGGAPVKSDGDGLFAVFAEAETAIKAAFAAQRLYLSYPPPGPLKVRIGLHTGRGVVVDGDYVGLDVHRAARVGAAGHGGQILVSAPTRELLRSMGDFGLVDLGWYDLKGLSRPEHLHQANGTGLPVDFPRLRASSSDRSHLPRQITALIGRENDIAAIASLLAAGERLITLTGPGGIGKSRLAVAAAEEAESQFREGIRFVSLASVSEPERVADAIAMGIGRNIEGVAHPEEVIIDELSDRPLLLIVDNFEQVVGAASLLQTLLERLPQLQIVVTSRISLQLSGEREYPVQPLQLPDADNDPNQVGESPAVRLLLARARSVRPDLVLTSDNSSAVARLVRRLDGIPLAIELAAARLRLLDPGEALKRLDSALDLPGAVDLPPRQRTLRAAIDWSHQLLGNSEQSLLRRLGVFVDGWTLESAEIIARGGDVSDVASALDTLAAHSLIRLETSPLGTVRMRLLGPILDYARERLGESGERDQIEARHARFFGSWVEAYPRGPDMSLSDWETRTSGEWGNIRQAIIWSVEHADHQLLAGLLTSLWPILWQRDRTEETRTWLDQIRPNLTSMPASVQGKVFHVDGFFAQEAGDYQHACAQGFKALEIANETEDQDLAAHARLLLAGSLPGIDPKDDRVLGLINEAADIFRLLDDYVSVAYALNYLCSYHASRGELDAARRAIEQALVIAEQIEVLPIRAQSYSALAFVDLLSGDFLGAEDALTNALEALAKTPNREVLSYVLDGYGWWALAQGREIAGMTAIGAAEGVRSRVGLRTWPLTTAQISLLSRLADSYEDPEAQAARKAGRDLTPEAALAVVTGTPEPVPAAVAS